MELYKSVDGVGKDGANVERSVAVQEFYQQGFHGFGIASHEIHFAVPMV